MPRDGPPEDREREKQDSDDDAPGGHLGVDVGAIPQPYDDPRPCRLGSDVDHPVDSYSRLERPTLEARGAGGLQVVPPLAPEVPHRWYSLLRWRREERPRLKLLEHGTIREHEAFVTYNIIWLSLGERTRTFSYLERGLPSALSSMVA